MYSCTGALVCIRMCGTRGTKCRRGVQQAGEAARKRTRLTSDATARTKGKKKSKDENQPTRRPWNERARGAERGEGPKG